MKINRQYNNDLQLNYETHSNSFVIVIELIKGEGTIIHHVPNTGVVFSIDNAKSAYCVDSKISECGSG